jgi:hypothetical protein
MAFSGVDKFPLVAKILVDMRLQELVEENQRLKAEKEKFELLVFWQTHNIHWFNRFIQDTLQTQVKGMRRTFSNVFHGERWECKLRLAFKNLAEEHGLSAVPEDDDNYPYSQFFGDLSSNPEDRDEGWKIDFCSGDVHFVVTSSDDEFLVHGYGQKLMQAKSIHDPEVVKLKKFFQTLEGMRP